MERPVIVMQGPTIKLGRIFRGCSDANRKIPAEVLEERVRRACGYALSPAKTGAGPAVKDTDAPHVEMRAAQNEFACMLGANGLTERMAGDVTVKIFEAVNRLDADERKNAFGDAVAGIASLIGMMEDTPAKQIVARGAVAELVKVAADVDTDTKKTIKKNLVRCQSLRLAVIDFIEAVMPSSLQPDRVTRAAISLIDLDAMRLKELLHGVEVRTGNTCPTLHGQIIVPARARHDGRRVDANRQRFFVAIDGDDAVPAEVGEPDTVRMTSEAPEHGDTEEDPWHDTVEDAGVLDPDEAVVICPEELAAMASAAPTQSQRNEALFRAIEEKDIEKAEQALGDGADVNAQDAHLQTPLMRAVINDDRYMMGMLLRWRADADRSDGTGWTALMFAASSGKRQMVIDLLFMGASRGIKNDRGETAHRLAVGHPSIANIIEDTGDWESHEPPQ